MSKLSKNVKDFQKLLGDNEDYRKTKKVDCLKIERILKYCLNSFQTDFGIKMIESNSS